MHVGLYMLPFFFDQITPNEITKFLGAIVRGAIVRGAIVRGAIVRGAIVRGAIVWGAIVLEPFFYNILSFFRNFFLFLINGSQTHFKYIF